MSDELFRIDGVLWSINKVSKVAIAYCPADRVALRCDFPSMTYSVKCDECSRLYEFERTFQDERIFVVNKVIARDLAGYEVIDFDGAAIPLAEGTAKDEKHFVVVKLMNTKVGKRLVVYVGEQGENQKVQIFIEPDIKRLAFDQKDQHPSAVFLALEATFSDGTKHKISKSDI